MKKENVLVPVLFSVKANVTRTRTIDVAGDLSSKSRRRVQEDDYIQTGYVIIFVKSEDIFEHSTYSQAKDLAKQILFCNDSNTIAVNILEVNQLFKFDCSNFQNVSLAENGTFTPKVFEPKYPAKKGKK